MINRCYDLSLEGIEAASNCNKTIWVGQNRFMLLFMILKMYSAEDHFFVENHKIGVNHFQLFQFLILINVVFRRYSIKNVCIGRL